MVSGIQNPDSLTWGESLKLNMRQLSLYTLEQALFVEDVEKARK